MDIGLVGMLCACDERTESHTQDEVYTPHETLDQRPNIILIMADNLGWGDTGYSVNPRAYLFVVSRNLALNKLRHLELKRTKPYGYSLFNIDAMAMVCHILSTPEDNLWTFTLPDGRGMEKSMAFIDPFIADKSTWPLKPDVMYWDQWPVRHPALLFAGSAYYNSEYIDLWRTLHPLPETEEGLRNFPIREPILWVKVK